MSVPHAPTVLISIGRAAIGACAILGSGFFAMLLLSLRHAEQVPAAVIAALFGVAGLSLWRPQIALVALAMLIPVANWTGRTWNGSVAWAETLAVAFAAGYIARVLRRSHRPSSPDELHAPVFVFTTMVVASLAVRLAVLYATIGGEALGQQLIQLVARDYFVSSGGFRDLDAAMRLIEGMLLLRAASVVVRRDPAYPPRLVRWFVIGAATAAVLNLWRLWQGALRTDAPLDAFVRYLATIRYNVHYADVNAAGSYFVMALLPAAAIAFASRRLRWIAAAVLIASSLMLSGSRTALAAGGLAGLVWAVVRLGQGRVGRRSRLVLAVSSIVLVLAALGAVYAMSARLTAAPPSMALQIRLEFARMTARMVAEHPAFGIGIGRYVERSGSYLPAVPFEGFRLYSENAHNNFLQVLGELGMLGFAGFVWVLGSAGFRCWRLMRRSTDQPLSGAVAAGVLAFVVTWLAGHPLLIDEPALLFWLLLGTAIGWGVLRQPEPTSSMRRIRAIGLILAVVLTASIPFRANEELADTNLEHRGIGLSLWQHGEDGIRYRVAGARSSVFVPAHAGVVTFPLRGARPGLELGVRLRLDGRLANVVRIPSDRWYDVQLIIPAAERIGVRFIRVDLEVEGEWPQDERLLMVGKVEPR